MLKDSPTNSCLQSNPTDS